MHENEKWKWSCSVVSNSQRPHGLQPNRLLRPWDFPSKSTGVGCHCLLCISSEGIAKLNTFFPLENKVFHERRGLVAIVWVVEDVVIPSLPSSLPAYLSVFFLHLYLQPISHKQGVQDSHFLRTSSTWQRRKQLWGCSRVCAISLWTKGTMLWKRNLNAKITFHLLCNNFLFVFSPASFSEMHRKLCFWF